MKATMGKRTILTVTLLSFIILLSSCSTINFSRWGILSNHEDEAHGVNGAIASFVSGVRPFPGNPDSHYLLASYYQKRGEYKKAAAEFKKVILIDPQRVGAYNGLGISLDEQRDFTGAVQAYQKALQINPKLDYVLNNLGYSYLLQGHPDKAIPLFQKAVSLNGHKQEFHNNLGLAYALKGRLEQALAEFVRGGDNTQAHYNIAQFYAGKRVPGIAQSHHSGVLRSGSSLARVNSAHSPEYMAQTSAQSEASEYVVSPVPAAATVSKPVSLAIYRTGAKMVKENESDQRITEKIVPVSKPEVTVPGSAVIPAKPPAIVKLPTKHAIPKGTGIEVSNGNGVNGMAHRMSKYLRRHGIPVIRITNADNFRHRKTTIYYKNGYREVAEQLANQINGVRDMKKRKRFDRPQIDVKIIIGRDVIYTFALQEGRSSL